MAQAVSTILSSSIIVGLFSFLLKSKFASIDDKFKEIHETLNHYEEKSDVFYKDMHKLETKIELMIAEQKYTVEKLAQISKDLDAFLVRCGHKIC